MSKADKLLIKMAVFAAIVLIAAFWNMWAYAESLRPVTIQWDMEAITDLAGFDLRINEDNTTIINIGADITAWAGSLVLLDDQNIVEIRSKDLAGQVSGWSDPAYYDPVPGKPRITLIVIQE